MVTEASQMCPDCFQFHVKNGVCMRCGFQVQMDHRNALTLPMGTLLGNRYLIGRVLGIGGFGITYKAFDTLYREVCAVKEFAPGGVVQRAGNHKDMIVYNEGNAQQFRHGMMRFMEEAQMLKRLEKEPAVVHVKECFTENQTAYFVMEFLDGSNLKKIIKNPNMKLASKDILWIITEIGNVMGIIHRKTKILHRDISPENIFLLKDGSVKILDFGSARQQLRNESQEFSVEFKHGFAPPEQYTRTGKQGTYTDVYALASTCYFTLTGKRVPDAMDRINGSEYTPLCELRSDISKSVSAAIDRALLLDYRKRTQTMEEFVQGLNPEYRPSVELSHKQKTAKNPYLEVLSGKKAGVRWKLPGNTKISIGRSPKSSNIVIDSDPLISKVHCCLIYDESAQEFLLMDVSRNGVLVDGKKIEKDKVYRYKPGIEISLANRLCTIKAGVFYE